MSQQNDDKLSKLSAQELELWKLRHTTEHVLHQAIKELYPSIHLAMGPATDQGFYFDFDPSPKGEDPITISEADFPQIEKKMQELINRDLPLIKEERSIEEAKKLFMDNPYKMEWLNEIENRGELITTYWTGQPNESGSMVDLCSGPHANSTGQIKAFKLLSLAGAYWRGDEKNKMLTRIYGTAFSSQEELDQYLHNLEEAKKRDHRKLGKELELFAVSEKVGQGLVLWLPKGQIIKDELENWAKKTENKWGYQRVTTPNITRSELYYTSGHLPYYKDDMYPAMKDDEGEYYLKPMNCPHHHMIYDSRPRSYKELPLRLAEYGTCYRYEASGQLFGLMRVRGFTQNDAHIYCTEEQAVQEFVNVMKLHEFFYKSLGIEHYHLILALRDPKNKQKYHGNEAMWEKAEALMRQAVSQVDIPMKEEIGSAAFYGPKIDFVIHSSIGREFAISTNQIDLFMGERFKLKYTAIDGKEKTPVIIHRAPLGSHERFIGFLIEHFGGAFPIWLSPVQVAVLPINDKVRNYVDEVIKQLKDASIRFELHEDDSLNKRIRQAEITKVPYMLIIGEKEANEGKVSLRSRGERNLGQLTPTELIQLITKKVEEKSLVC